MTKKWKAVTRAGDITGQKPIADRDVVRTQFFRTKIAACRYAASNDAGALIFNGEPMWNTQVTKEK